MISEVCVVSPVTCHMSHVTNANMHSHIPSPCYLPKYAQQDVAADLDQDQSTMSCEDPPINFVFAQQFLAISEPILQILGPKCSHYFSLRIFFVTH